MDPDSPWEKSSHANGIPEAEWTRISSEFTNFGYREGIMAGKEAFLQAGFDSGFASVGVPLGRELGHLRGMAAALRSFLQSQDPHSLDLEELHGISSALSVIRFVDIAPRDLEAEQHARDHFASEDPTPIENTQSGTTREPQESCASEDVTKLKMRLAILCAKLGLPVLA